MTIAYDKFTLNHQMLLDLTMEEGIGTVTHDRAKPRHEMTFHSDAVGPTWVQLASRLNVLDFNELNYDFLDCPQADTTDLDFTTGDFSMALWLYPDDIAAWADLIVRGRSNNDGWQFFIERDTGQWKLGFYTYNGAFGNRVTYGTVGSVPIAGWCLAGMTRSGPDILIYVNGVDDTDVPDVHLDPATANRELHIGIYDNELSNPMLGMMWRPRIWGRHLSAWEMKRLFNLERDYFGV